jgi:ankyrin repeat protein
MRLFLSIIVTAIWCMRPAVCPAQTSVSDRFYQAIRNDNARDLKALIGSQDVNAKDSRGATPLMYAAAFGNARQMKLLLEAGADVNAQNTFHATALIWAGGDAVKSRLLIEHGADINVRTQQGRTALMAAAKRNGNADLVRLLLEKGADVKTPGDTTLILAAQSGDVEIMRLLIDSGADVNCISPRLGETPLMYAAASDSVEAVRFLLAKGANPNVGLKSMSRVIGGSTLDTGIGKQTPLMWAAPTGSPELIRALIDAGANVNAQDIQGISPLMLAVASENQDLGVVKVLLQSGANVNPRSGRGETALDWAKKFGSRPVIAALQEAGAREGVPYQAPPVPDRSTTRDAAKAVEQSIALLQRSSAEFFKQSGCVGCHHQDATAFAVRAARAAGIPLDEAVARERVNVMKSSLGSEQELQLQGVLAEAISIKTNHLAGLWASGYNPDIVTDAAVVSVVSGQYTDGHWQRYIGAVRSPTGVSNIVGTAEAVLALQRYGIPARAAEFRERVTRASVWLQKATPHSTYEHALQLLALAAAGVGKDAVKRVADSLLAQQRSDGGWAGNPNLRSDAHSTGVALHALRESGFLSAAGLAHRRGVQYLLSTQYPDGSWHVRSRAAGFQPYFQSGFPFEHDQWISAAATAWAAEALARSIESSAAGIRKLRVKEQPEGR